MDNRLFNIQNAMPRWISNVLIEMMKFSMRKEKTKGENQDLSEYR